MDYPPGIAPPTVPPIGPNGLPLGTPTNPAAPNPITPAVPPNPIETPQPQPAAPLNGNAIVPLTAPDTSNVALATPLIDVLGGGFHAVPGKFELTVSLTRIMYPFIFLVSFAALAMGMLNAKNVFGAPAMASSFLQPRLHRRRPRPGHRLSQPPLRPREFAGPPGRSFGLDARTARQIWWLYGMAFGTLLGGFLQFVVQLPPLRQSRITGFRFDFDWRDEGVRTILRLMGPAVIAASAVQVNVAVNTSFASQPGQRRGVVAQQCAFRSDATPTGNVRRGHRHRDPAAGEQKRGDRETWPGLPAPRSRGH